MDPFRDRRRAFAALHEAGCFVIPNPWDVGSARYLARLGFPALATTSAGMQYARGEPESLWGTPLEAALAHIREIVEATDLPVNADFQAGYARDAEGVGRNVARCIDCGVAGVSIEDGTGERDAPLYPLEVAVERLAAARAAIDAGGAQVLLIARAESFLVGHPSPLADAIRRLVAYAEAGADVLYAPCPATREDLAAIVGAVAPKPVNALVGADRGLSVSDLAELGVRRISVGSAFARVAWGAFTRAAAQVADEGCFAGLGGAASFDELNAAFGG